MDGTILSQGSFVVATGVPSKVIAVPSNLDFMYVYNYTNAAKVGAATGLGVSYYWQRGMAAGTGLVEYYGNGTAVKSGDTLVSGGFTLYDPSGQSVGALPLIGAQVATTASTNATNPVVSTASTAGLVASSATAGSARGSIIRMSATAQTDVNGVDFVISAIVANTSFTIGIAGGNGVTLATAPGAVGGAGFYRIVNYDPMFYPRNRTVVQMSQATNAVVTVSVPHGLTPGQLVRFSVPRFPTGVTGMYEADGLTATILSVTNDFVFTVDLNTASFSAFAWPTIAQITAGAQFPQIVPVGENTASSLSIVAAQVPSIGGQQINATQSGILADSVVNTGFLGMLLGTGGVGTVAGALAISGPAGTTAADVVYWRAGKSSFGGL